MKQVWIYIKQNPINFLLLAIPIAVFAEYSHYGSMVVFVASAIGVVPLAGLIGSATEVLASKTGPKIGGLLNASLGNAAELIITLIAIRAGLIELAKASITGSILGNLLLVMGFAMLTGGLKNGVQKFDRRHTGNHAILLVVAVVALAIPSLFSYSIGPAESIGVEALSLGVAAVMIVIYMLGIIYALKFSKSPITFTTAKENNHSHHPQWKLSTAIIVLGISTFGVAFLSELLVGAIDEVVKNFGLSEFFLGIILIPIVGNVAEHLVAVQVAIRNEMDLSVEISLSSSLQVALFVSPLLVFISLLMGNPLTLVFNNFELISLGAAVMIAVLVAMDGESNWLEGAALLGVYLILGIGFFLLPT
ncbi:MAG: calcium/proton exchanger [Anaerolineae bacterium]|nr:calcium/proton exchanger [Anaerolineae bacterium]